MTIIKNQNWIIIFFFSCISCACQSGRFVTSEAIGKSKNEVCIVKGHTPIFSWMNPHLQPGIIRLDNEQISKIPSKVTLMPGEHTFTFWVTGYIDLNKPNWDSFSCKCNFVTEPGKKYIVTVDHVNLKFYVKDGITKKIISECIFDESY